MACCAVPAAALVDPAVAAWVRSRGVAVHARGHGELDAAVAAGTRPVHVVLRCDPGPETVRWAARLGVTRFVVSAERHVDALTRCPETSKFVYLDEQGPAVLGERRLDVVGMHCDVTQPDRPEEWAASVERLLARMALMRTWGSVLTRLSLAGGQASAWLTGDAGQARAIAAAVDDALDDGCARWRLPRPAVTLAPLDA